MKGKKKKIKVAIKNVCMFVCITNVCERIQKSREKHENEHAPMRNTLPTYNYILRSELKSCKRS